MECECLPFTTIPHTSRLFSDYLYHYDRVAEFYARQPLRPDWLPQQAAQIQYDPQRRARVAAILERQNRGWGASAETLANIARLRDGAAAAVTGQQVGLFGGPAYSLYKALSATKVAGKFTSSGVATVPVFWLATEDHDFAEIASAVLLGNGGLERFTAASTAKPHAPVGSIALGSDITKAVARARELLGDSPAADWLAECYTPGQSWGSAFARLFCRAFARLGLIVIDPLDPELHDVGASIFSGVVEKIDALNRAVVDRGKKLTEAGYHEQVKVTASSSFLFRMVEGERVPLLRANGGFAAGDQKFSAKELAQRAADVPREFSASALLRPVLQDFLLPTIVSIGGPAEIAYYAQSGPLFEQLLGRVTPILPRFSATLVEPHAARVLDKYGSRFAELLHTGNIGELLAARSLLAELEQQFEVAIGALDKSMGGITASLDQLDHTLVDAANRAGAKMRYQLERLRGRASRAQLRRSEVIAAHAAQLSAALRPEGDLQERVVAGVSFLARYPDLLDKLEPLVQSDCPDHKVVRL